MHFIDFWKVKEMDFKKKLYWTKIKIQAFFIKLKINMNPKVRNIELSEEKSEELYQKIIEKINNQE
jgi:hypothetical protein